MNDRIYYSRDAELRAMRERALAVGIFMALGLGIGAVLALMFAPKSGSQVRKELAEGLDDRLDSGREATNKTLHRLEKDFAELRKKVEERLSER
jgi:gas vesicle protein